METANTSGGFYIITSIIIAIILALMLIIMLIPIPGFPPWTPDSPIISYWPETAIGDISGALGQWW